MLFFDNALKNSRPVRMAYLFAHTSQWLMRQVSRILPGPNTYMERHKGNKHKGD